MTQSVNNSGKQFIGGQRIALGERCLNSLCAYTQQPTGYQFYQTLIQEVGQAAQAAMDVFPLYSQMTLSARAQFLSNIADELDTLDDEFIELVKLETALSTARINSELNRTSQQLRLFANFLISGNFYAARIDTALPTRQPLPRPDIRQYRTAIGPVAVFGASNFPLAFSTAGGDTASALAAGCPVIFKAHSSHMATAEKIGEAIERAVKKSDMPNGVFNMLFGHQIGAELVKHPAVKAVGFTGSLTGGKALLDRVMQRPDPIPFFAEMSSINPVIVMENALLQRGKTIAAELFSSFTLGVGQFCTKPGVILGIRSTHFNTFINELVQQTITYQPQTMLNKGIFEHYQEGIKKLDQHTSFERLAIGEQVENCASAMLYNADINLLLNHDPLLQTEIFGPLTIVIEARDETELYQAAQQFQGQLTTTFIADRNDFSQVQYLTQLFMHKAGRLVINGYPTGVELCDAMVHGGPFPATSDARGTSVGTLAIERFLRPVCFQNYPNELLPSALKNDNLLNIHRLVNGAMTYDTLT